MTLEFIKKYILVPFLVISIGLGVTIYRQQFKSSTPAFIALDTSSTTMNDNHNSIQHTVIVHIGGEVKNPGLYTITANVRVIDALELAGGMLTTANPDKVNLAARITDGQRIMIPKKKEKKEKKKPTKTPSPSAGSPKPTTRLKKININQASASQLTRIKGIGPKTARLIIAYRNDHGPFKSHNELSHVKGIGPKTLKKISPYITL